jgi:hypothetical protein
MSDEISVGPEKTVPAKEPVSPVRNIIGFILLLAVVVFGGIEVWAKYGYTSAVKKLDARAEDDSQDLLTVAEAETLLGKQPDGQAVDAQVNEATYSKRTYTWNGLFTHYTLAAYYTKSQKDSRLHHYEPEGTTYTPEAKPEPTSYPKSKGEGGTGKKKASGKGGAGKKSSGAAPKSGTPDAKAPGAEPAPSDKPAGTDKGAPSDKPAPSKDAPSDKDKPAAPSDDGSTKKPATDPAPAKPSE